MPRGSSEYPETIFGSPTQYAGKKVCIFEWKTFGVTCTSAFVFLKKAFREDRRQRGYSLNFKSLPYFVFFT